MDQTQARRRAKQYGALGFNAIARTKGGWPKPDEEWFVFIQAQNGEYYQEFDVRVRKARDAWTRQHAAKPDTRCRCGYDPVTRQDLDDHIEAASRLDDGTAHG